jgi:hypothetical protein
LEVSWSGIRAASSSAGKTEVRVFVAILLCAIGLAGAIPLATFRTSHSYSDCATSYDSPRYPCTIDTRPAWAIPVAIVVAALGIGAGAALATRRRPSAGSSRTKDRNQGEDSGDHTHHEGEEAGGERKQRHGQALLVGVIVALLLAAGGASAVAVAVFESHKDAHAPVVLTLRQVMKVFSAVGLRTHIDFDIRRDTYAPASLASLHLTSPGAILGEISDRPRPGDVDNFVAWVLDNNRDAAVLNRSIAASTSAGGYFPDTITTVGNVVIDATFIDVTPGYTSPIKQATSLLRAEVQPVR